MVFVLALQEKRDEALAVCVPPVAPVTDRLAGPDDHLAEDDPDQTIVVGLNLAKVQRELKQREEAQALLTQVLPVANARYGETSSLQLSVLGEMAFLLQQEGNDDQAVELLEEALRDAEATVFPVSFIAHQVRLARMYMGKNRLEESLTVYTQARNRSAATRSEQYFQVAHAEHQMGLIHLQLGNSDTAEKLFFASLRKQEMLALDDLRFHSTKRKWAHMRLVLPQVRSASLRHPTSSAGTSSDTAGSRRGT